MVMISRRVPDPRARRAWGWRIAWPAALLLLALVSAALWVTAPPPMPAYADVRAAWQPSEAWLYDRDGRIIDSERVDFQRRRMAWTALADVAPLTRDTVIAAEDRRFTAHGGVDWMAVGGSVRARLEGRRGRGASTIAMQLAAFLAPELARPGRRGTLQKLRQMRAAQHLTSNWSRDQILEAYLNLAPLRGEAQGIGAGAHTFFAKKPAAMNRTDALLFAAILPNPGAQPDVLGRRACRLAHAAAASDRCKSLMLAAANLATSERGARIDPALAPHLAVRLLTRPGMRVTSTLDRGVQVLAVRALRRQLTGLGSDRARDGAVVVLDNVTGDVLAYVGGVGLQSTASSVDGARARRQAGSTLKPHLYAQVIEQGWLTAASILDDSPVQLDTASGLYVPKNYDHSFKGPVSVRHALAGSLNVPAVRALLLGDVQAFRDRLWDLGYHGLSEDGEYYGFSLALGSAEVSLVEQANAFRVLANGGLFAPVRMTAGDPRTAPRRVLSAEAAFITSDILADASARAGSFGVDSALRLPFWAAAKTGTSKAMRDNWCVGFSDRFTVAVWVGNLEGDSMRAVSGTSGAAPVWRDVMLALHADRPGKAPPPPPGVEARMVTLDGTREPPRREYFLRGTGQSAQAAVPAAARRPRIVNPVSGSVYARDPDIPPGQQQLAVVVAGASAGHRLLLDGKALGDAAAGASGAVGGVQLPMLPGAHRLTLVDPGGRMIDQIRFTVR
ncbi:MAG: hypothetical protein RLZZ58_2192 [Pseudomonadota bacterium]